MWILMFSLPSYVLLSTVFEKGQAWLDWIGFRFLLLLIGIKFKKICTLIKDCISAVIDNHKLTSHYFKRLRNYLKSIYIATAASISHPNLTGSIVWWDLDYFFSVICSYKSLPKTSSSLTGGFGGGALGWWSIRNNLHKSPRSCFASELRQKPGIQGLIFELAVFRTDGQFYIDGRFTPSNNSCINIKSSGDANKFFGN